MKDAKSLNIYYIPTRCPDGFDRDLAPTEFYILKKNWKNSEILKTPLLQKS